MSEMKVVPKLSAFAILCMYMMTSAAALITPALETFFMHWPDYNVNLLATVPTLFIVIGTFISGFLVGKVKYRTMAIVGSMLFIIGGCAPYFFDNFWLTVGCRAIFGLGNGFIIPVGTALAVGLYEGQKQAQMVGLGTLFLNAGAIILQTLGGVLAGMNYSLVFLGHLFGIITLIMAMFLPEPENMPVDAAEKEKIRYPKGVIVAGLLMFIFCVIDFAVMMNVSFLFAERNAGGPEMSAMALNFYTIMGCVAGLIYSMIFKHAPRWTLPLAYLFTAIGPALIYFSDTFLPMTIGLGCTGFGFAIMMPVFMTWVGLEAKPSQVAACTAFVMAMLNLGNFASTFYMEGLMAVFGETVYSVLYMELIIQAIFTVIFVLYDPLKIKKRIANGEVIESA